MQTIDPKTDKCQRSDLRALVPVYDRYDVADDGSTTDFSSPGSSDHDVLDIEEYECDHCGTFFTPKERYNYVALKEAWDTAVAHTDPKVLGGAPAEDEA